MAIIYQTKNFVVNAAKRPHITREDGGHIVISPQVRMIDRQRLTPKEAVELMRLTIIVGEAMATGMNRNGIDVGRINYQDNGNWSVFKAEGPYLHVHLYGRAKSAKIQKYGQACHFPHKEEDPDFYKDNEPLNQEDIQTIRADIERQLSEDNKYHDSEWSLV